MKRHDFDAISFVFGLMFTLFGLTFLIVEDPWDLVFDSISFGWVLPLVVIAVGAALLVSVLRPKAGAITDSPLTSTVGKTSGNEAATIDAEPADATSDD